jgi:hypothetical protein
MDENSLHTLQRAANIDPPRSREHRHPNGEIQYETSKEREFIHICPSAAITKGSSVRSESEIVTQRISQTGFDEKLFAVQWLCVAGTLVLVL